MCGSVQDKRRWARGRKTRGCYLLAQPHAGGAQGERDQGSRGSHRSCPTVDSEIAGTRIESSLLSAFLKALEFLPTEKKKKKKEKKALNTSISYLNVDLITSVPCRTQN